MTVISFIQSKGGSGKSTLLCALALTLTMQGRKIAILDTDPQGTASKFAEQYNIPYVKETDDPKIKPTIQALKEQGYEHILVDTAGYKSALIVYVVMSSDCVIIPSRVSEPDAQGLFTTLEHIKASATEHTKVFTVLNAVKPHTNIAKVVLNTLKDSDVPLLSSKMGNLTGFEEMHSTGHLKPIVQTAINSFIASLEKENVL